MRGPYSDYAAPPIYIYPDRPRPAVRFSRIELFQLAVAILALSLALTILYVRSALPSFLEAPATLFGLFFATSLVAVGTGVGLHEIMHKVVAQRYGLAAEFRYNPMGLALAFVFAFIGFIYGAPGATWIAGQTTQEQDGRISAAGPGTNVVLAVVFLGLETLFSPESMLATIAYLIVVQAAFMNLVLAGFNMLPFMPLDGAKVWRWNKAAYLGIVGLVLAIFAASVYARLLPI